jgi:drug/metabolite transporter (DMT)-like permease
MLSVINTWQFNLFMGLSLMVMFAQFYKLAVKNAKVDGAVTIILQLIGGLSVLIWIPFFKIVFPTDLKTYALLLLAIIFYAINDRLQTTARKHLEVSVFSIIKQLSTVFIIIIGLTIFREPVIISKMIGAGIILLGNVFLLYKKGRLDLNKYVVYSILANITFAIAMSTDIGIAKLFNLPIYISITLVVPALIIFLAEKMSISTIIEEYKHGIKKYYYITGVAWGLAILFSLRTFQFGQVTTIVPLQSTAVIINVLIAYFFLKERDNLPKKILAALIVMLGIYFTVLR